MSEDAVDVARHRDSLIFLTSSTGPIRKDAPTATRPHPQWTRNGHPTAARLLVRRQVMDAVRARYASAVAGRNAIVLVGPPASGKSTILRELTKADAADWMIVDADEVKDLLLEQALRDGSYDQAELPRAMPPCDRG